MGNCHLGANLVMTSSPATRFYSPPSFVFLHPRSRTPFGRNVRSGATTARVFASAAAVADGCRSRRKKEKKKDDRENGSAPVRETHRSSFMLSSPVPVWTSLLPLAFFFSWLHFRLSSLFRFVQASPRATLCHLAPHVGWAGDCPCDVCVCVPLSSLTLCIVLVRAGLFLLVVVHPDPFDVCGDLLPTTSARPSLRRCLRVLRCVVVSVFLFNFCVVLSVLAIPLARSV